LHFKLPFTLFTMSDIDSFMKQVATFFYNSWSKQDWNSVGQLYTEKCKAIYGDKAGKLQGPQQICEKMNAFGKMAFDTENLTVDVLDYEGKIYLVQIVGKFQLEGQENPLNFSQTWNCFLNQDGDNVVPQILLDVFKPVY